MTEGKLNLLADFPAVTAAEWQAAIAQDLNGADYEETLVWRTDEGIAVQPFYLRADTAGLAPPERLFPAGSGDGWEEAQDYVPPAGSIRADRYHEAGGTAVQELAFGLAEAVEKLASEANAARAAQKITFVFAVGSTWYMEIAKLRAARLLWRLALSGFGVHSSQSLPRIHVRTSQLNKSWLDPYTNLLRVTTEAMSAVIGGCDSLTVEPFGFNPHLAANVQRILREEANLGRVADPAAGSYYVEVLTDAVAREAWKLFQRIEGEGGWNRAVDSGFAGEQLRTSRAAKAQAIASRRRTLVGVNNYPDLADKNPAIPAPGAIGDDFGPFRLAEPFEQIRRRTLAHAERTSRYPRVLLLTRGDVRMKGARANFCLNLLGCAGFDIVESEEYANAASDLIVLCSSDAEYPAFAADVLPNVSVPVLVAGNPKEHIERLRAIGVAGFVHALSNAVDTLTECQNRLGMEVQQP